MQKYYLELHGRNVSAGENFAIGIRLDPCRNTIYTHIVGMSVQEKKIQCLFLFHAIVSKYFSYDFFALFCESWYLMYHFISIHDCIFPCTNNFM